MSGLLHSTTLSHCPSMKFNPHVVPLTLGYVCSNYLPFPVRPSHEVASAHTVPHCHVTCLLYSLVRLLTLSPFLSTILQIGDFKFLSVWNLIQLVIIKACSYALHISASVHPLRSPFRNHCHVFSHSTPVMSFLTICFSSFSLSSLF